MPKPHVFTIIMDTYNRPAFLREAVTAVRRQTYENLEIILVNNGATPETVEYLHEVESQDNRVKLVHFEENQFSWDDPAKMFDVCLNAGLKAATGDYVWYQSDDDWMADDYAEKMVALFQGNSECTTASGLAVYVDATGNIIDEPPTNFRPRYMPGHELTLAYVRGNSSYFKTPGSMFTFKRDVLVKAGGFHRAGEHSQFYGITPFGVFGFDATARFYWRRHEGQLNLMLSARGWIGIKEVWDCLKEWEIERRWQIFGADVAREVVSYLKKSECRRAALWFVQHLAGGQFSSARRILVLMWYRWHFWRLVTIFAPRVLLIGTTRRLLKRVIRWGFKIFPVVGRISPRFAQLRDRVER